MPLSSLSLKSFWGHLLSLSLHSALSPSALAQLATHQALSPLQVFAQAVLSAWEIQLPTSSLANFLSFSRSWIFHLNLWVSASYTSPVRAPVTPYCHCGRPVCPPLEWELCGRRSWAVFSAILFSMPQCPACHSTSIQLIFEWEIFIEEVGFQGWVGPDEVDRKREGISHVSQNLGPECARFIRETLSSSQFGRVSL